MSAQILLLAGHRGSAAGRLPERRHRGTGHRVGPQPQLRDQSATERFEFWSGASKRHYVHTIYDLLDCPDLPRVNYMLVRRETKGRCTILHIGHTDSRCGSENLAGVRHKAAMLGANEVHVHLLPETADARALVAMDLRAGLFGALAAEAPLGAEYGARLP